ncbi:MAG: chromosomal replication initiator protein DnaA [Nitrospinota bacterium]
MSPKIVWETCKKELEKTIDPHHFLSYIMPTKQLKYSDNELSILVPSRFLADWLEKNYMDTIREAINRVTSTANSISLVVENARPKEVRTAAPAMKQLHKPVKKAAPASKFTTKYSFDSFVVGSCNQFAYASSVNCAKKPGAQYNPLFLYGGVGLGKTHLMQSIGHYIQLVNDEANVLYLSSEQFVNQMISAMQKGRMDGFRRKYRNLDVLLVDDIQFIGGKERTQEEFFHTFNTLFEMGKQIVVSSDQFPKDIRKLEERLKSRFEWGLIADIQPPDLETKIAIIRKKAAQNGYDIPDEVAEFLAHAIRSNIRELEGCLARVVAYSSLSGKPIDLSLAKETLEGVYSDSKKHVDIAQIQKAVIKYFGLKPNDLKSKSRAKTLVVARQLAMYLCRQYTEESLPQIGKFFGGRDHSTVIHATKKIKKEIEVNTKLYNELKSIEKILDL